jgi:hypothetical protein
MANRETESNGLPEEAKLEEPRPQLETELVEEKPKESVSGPIKEEPESHPSIFRTLVAGAASIAFVLIISLVVWGLFEATSDRWVRTTKKIPPSDPAKILSQSLFSDQPVQGKLGVPSNLVEETKLKMGNQ